VRASEAPMDATDALIDRRSVQLPRHIPIPYQTTFLDASNTVSEPHCAQLIPANFTHDLGYIDDAYAPIGNLPALQLSTNVIAAPLPKATAQQGSEAVSGNQSMEAPTTSATIRPKSETRVSECALVPLQTCCRAPIRDNMAIG